MKLVDSKVLRTVTKYRTYLYDNHQEMESHNLHLSRLGFKVLTKFKEDDMHYVVYICTNNDN